MLSVSSTCSPFCGHCLALPPILQWNTNGLRTGLSELRRGLLHTPIYPLALQEANVLLSEGRIYNFTVYHNTLVHPSGRSKYLLYVHVDVDRAELDVSGFCSGVVEYAGVQFAVCGSSVSIISTWVLQKSPWDPRDISRFRAFWRDHLIICGDFNAHHTFWGSHHDSPGGRTLMDVFWRI